MALRWQSRLSKTIIMWDSWLISMWLEIHQPLSQISVPSHWLQLYMKTEALTVGMRPLFLLLRNTASGKLSPDTISTWLKKTISLAYEVVGKDVTFILSRPMI